MTELSEGNFFQRAIYEVANSFNIPFQYMMGRGIGDGSMRNLNGTATTTDEGVMAFGTLPLWFGGGGGAGGAAEGGSTAFRYMTEGELTAIKNTKLLRGGNAGETFFTKDLYKSASKAQARLALPNSPTLRVEFEILNNPTLLQNGTKVRPGFGMPGRGSEFMTTDQVRVKLINWQSLGH